MMRFLHADVAEAARLHALRDYPNEACGAVTPDGYVPLANLSTDPTNAFRCDGQLEPLIMEGRLLALIHSHPAPGHSLSPSEMDIAQQVAMDVPWGIVATDGQATLPMYFWGDQLDPPPLLGRDFRYGPSGTDGKGDCAALVRDWYRIERGIRLPEWPREDRCWIGKPDLYRQNILASGFTRLGGVLTMDEPEVGDLLLMNIRSRAPNHVAIYAGQGLILHHLDGRLSRTEPFGRWREFVTDWFRHGGAGE